MVIICIFFIAIVGDEDMDRKTQAEVLLNAYSRDLERKRLNAGAAGIVLTDGESLLSYLFREKPVH